MGHDHSPATVLFTDIVDSTARAAQMGDRAWRGLLDRHHAFVRRELRRFHGTEVATAGDGFLAVFAGPEPAILCASAIRDAVRELGLEVRCGLHMGKVERKNGEVGGIAVHIGARVAGQAAPGEVLVSSTVRDAEVGSEFGFEDRGVHELKGVPGQWRLHAVTSAPAPESPRPPVWRRLFSSARRPASIAIALAALLGLAGVYALVTRSDNVGPVVAVAESAGPGIAILPFSVNDPELDRWREGMPDLLATNLDGVGGVRAIDSRTVLSRWRQQVPDGESADLPTALDVARRSGATYGLVGSVVSSGTDMRVSADVYDVGSGQSLGQKQVNGPPDSVFALVDRLSIEVLGLILEEGAPSLVSVDLASITTASLPALRSYLEGEAAFRRSDFERAIPAYEAAIDADSSFALAHYRLGEARGWTESMESGRAREHMGNAARFADRLPARDRELAAVLGAYYMGDPAATRLAREATQKYPDDPQAWYLLGEVYFHLPFQSLASRTESDDAFVRATRLDPSFAPAYIHLLDNAFSYADSAAAAEVLARYDRLAEGSQYDALYGTVFRLAFADSAGRRSALAALDTLPLAHARRAVHMLRHPRLLGVQTDVVRSLERRPDASADLLGEWRTRNLAQRGRFQEAFAAMELSGLGPAERFDMMTIIYFNGFPIDSGAYEREFAPGPSDSFPSVKHFVAAIRAVEAGRWPEVEAMGQRLDEALTAMRARGDSIPARMIEASSRVIDGRTAMVRGRDEEALRILQAAVQEGAAPPLVLGWIMDLLVETGRPDEALLYGRLLTPDPSMGLRMGRLYEEVGDREKALEAYAWVTQAWAGADPTLQPRVAEARQAIARLRGLQLG